MSKTQQPKLPSKKLKPQPTRGPKMRTDDDDNEDNRMYLTQEDLSSQKKEIENLKQRYKTKKNVSNQSENDSDDNESHTKTIIDHYSQQTESEIPNLSTVSFNKNQKIKRPKQKQNNESEEDEEEEGEDKDNNDGVEKSWVDKAKENVDQIFSSSLKAIMEAQPKTILMLVGGFILLLLLIYLRSKCLTFFSPKKLQNSSASQNNNEDDLMTGFQQKAFSNRFRRI